MAALTVTISDTSGSFSARRRTITATLSQSPLLVLRHVLKHAICIPPNGGECYRKYNVTDSRFDRREDSAYKVGQSVIPPPASSPVNTNVASSGANTVSGSTGNVQPTSAGIPASSNPNLSTSRPYTPPADNSNVPTTRPTTTDLGAPATLIGSSTTTAASINPTLAYQPCPLSDNQQWTDSLGYVYDIKCGCDLQYSDLIAPHYDTFRDCILACDNYQPDPNIARGAPCIGVSWGGPNNRAGNCFLKYAVPQIRCGYPDFCAAVKHSYTISSNVISTSRSRVSISTASVVPVSPTSSSSSSTSSSPPRSDGRCGLTEFGYATCDPNGQYGGCCSQYGYCGRGDIYCGAGCLSGCNNPGVAASSLSPSISSISSSSRSSTPNSPASPTSSSSSSTSSSPPRSDGRCGLAEFGYATCDPNGQYGGCCSQYGYCGRGDVYCGAGCLSGCNNPGVAASSSSPAAGPSSSISSRPPVVVPSSSSSSTPLAVTSSTSTGVNPANTFAPPELSGSVRCPANNGSIYTDAVGQQWEVRCGQNIRGTNAKAVHADSWEKCLQFCSILGSVVGVTYPGGGSDNTNPQSISCYPYNIFTEFTSGAVPTLVAARPLNVSTGNYFNQDTLCPGYDNETYTDYYGRVYEVRCDHAYGGGTNLAPTITKSLEGCLSFCSIYNTCVGVTFTQYIVGSRTDNCFPKTALGEFTYQAGNSSAQLITR
ncbi:MAG: hypothetical protein Q9182_005913 [Xanthomendoza sp. 2 TL-2023]